MNTFNQGWKEVNDIKREEMPVEKFLKNLGLVLLLAIIIGYVVNLFVTTPQMAWSQSKDRCVKVEQNGKIIPDGCKKVESGELRAERYIVR